MSTAKKTSGLMFLDHKTIFLAGATGLVGSSILEHLIHNHPTAKIRASYFRRAKPAIKSKNVKYVFGDLRSGNDCKKMVKGCEGVIMAAANTAGANLTVSEPWYHVLDNVRMNLQMLKAFHHENIKRVVFIGSASMYQEFEGEIREEDLDLNKDPHPAHYGIGWTFRFIEKICKFWHEKTQIEFAIVRAANVFGPYAKFNPISSNFIPAII